MAPRQSGETRSEALGESSRYRSRGPLAGGAMGRAMFSGIFLLERKCYSLYGTLSQRGRLECLWRWEDETKKIIQIWRGNPEEGVQHLYISRVLVWTSSTSMLHSIPGVVVGCKLPAVPVSTKLFPAKVERSMEGALDMMHVDGVNRLLGLVPDSGLLHTAIMNIPSARTSYLCTDSGQKRYGFTSKPLEPRPPAASFTRSSYCCGR